MGWTGSGLDADAGGLYTPRLDDDDCAPTRSTVLTAAGADADPQRDDHDRDHHGGCHFEFHRGDPARGRRTAVVGQLNLDHLGRGVTHRSHGIHGHNLGARAPLTQGAAGYFGAASRERSSSCSRPLVASALPPVAVLAPVKSENWPPASASRTGMAAKS